MKIKIGALILVSVFALNSCKTKAVTDNSVKTNIKELVKSSDVILVDVRIPEQYAEATANDAVNIPLAELQNNIDTLKGKKVVVFCNKGVQADKAVEILKKNGVEVYDGTTWKNVKAIQQEKQ
ncbi:rhodanese-like domain-containing protein [Chryseobacterium sp. Ch-15]|uniref:Rhodanese-like domain-containing protein n=1 Tax=Chryseobacterium muglaense TaxID=2893752 RepID=A0A9Q3UY11_9FLAO|nr:MULTISPECIES: rhodanese-like domain-containing protein [Chryseobacterium]MBD3905975.1 rhodanese-like domain-containing protein [Chryseobacterium muglaense]MBO6185268.1 rhodanese-like domain-containing protein [Chryseobacterium sp.]MCC9035060.1 rhodanese-like domain-containing protein [Chryseobacterium muglaense]MCM2555773.1 rhodanese-like domain-containing protein [Chryseobacterium muglaense]